ncbi:DUF7331 family protein [Salinigranum halophilum]|jgi:hypothetical protein|uniref:DUF7331 family protein n=1 Tax=Salinigranum halophilum TaxID=2565931 RepID=UPI00191BF8E4|nr:hypothetical protein [Salinigranum halophilum]
MSDSTRADGRDRASDYDPAVDVETYEVDGGVVFFDAENPLAWVEAATTVRLTDVA